MTRLSIQQNPRHFDKLFEVVGISDAVHAKKVPCHELMNEVDDTPLLSAEKASRYRFAVGILLYLTSDLVECAYTIRGLAQFLSSSTERSWTMLTHLCLYLTSVRDNSLRLRVSEDGLWHSPSNHDGVVIELFSESDWAAHKGRSGVIFFQGRLLLSTSRAQRIVALSSAEAEIHAAVSTTCDVFLLRVCIAFFFGKPVRLKLILDNSAAKQVLQRSGVGRIRHLSCRMLWIQDLVKRKQLETAFIPTKENYADLGTKKFTQDRMHSLMHGVGVFNEDAGELVGQEVVDHEKSKPDFKGVLRMLCESAGGGRDRKSLVSAKQTLRMLFLTMMVSLSFWMLAAPITFCMFAAVFMMPCQFGDSAETEPEVDVETPGESFEMVRSYNKETAHCFLCLCIGHTLKLLSDAEFDEDRATEKRLNGTYDSLENIFTLFEGDGVSASNLRAVVQIHDNLRELDSNFNAFEFLSVAPEDGFSQTPNEPETETSLSPEPPADFDVESMGGPFEPRNPEDLVLWVIVRLSERLKPAMLQGLRSKVQRCVAQREIMMNLCRYRQENPEKRREAWITMQNLSDLSSSDDEDA
eukprot:s1227_g15.t1